MCSVISGANSSSYYNTGIIDATHARGKVLRALMGMM